MAHLVGLGVENPDDVESYDYLQLRDGLVNARRGGLKGHPIDEQVLEDRLDLFHHRRLEERPAQDRTELPRLVVAQLYRRGLSASALRP